jgi:hypothetical protein
VAYQPLVRLPLTFRGTFRADPSVIQISGGTPMLPLLVIGGVIGAIASIAKGASWLSDQVGASDGSASAGGKGGLTPLTEAQSSSFAATLAAQAAGQGVPTSTLATATPAPASTMIPQLHGTDYDSLARLQAGTFAYSHIGEQHRHHGGGAKPQDADGSAAVAGS